jgi:hypothetical protein
MEHIPDDAKGARFCELKIRKREFKAVETVRRSPGFDFEVGSPLAFFHAWENGQQVRQGFLDQYEPDGSIGVVFFSYMDGCIDVRVAVTESFLERCTFYDNDYDLRSANRPYTK